MLHYEKSGVQPSKEDLWIMKHKRKDETPIDAGSEVSICSITEFFHFAVNLNYLIF